MVEKGISLVHKLKAYDIVIISFYGFLTGLNIIYNEFIPNWDYFVLINVWIIVFTFILAYAEVHSKSKVWQYIHWWYVAPLIMITFKEIYFLVKPIRQQDYDYVFIAIDRFIFLGQDPTHMIYVLANPILTEILQIVYGIFYLLPLILLLVLLKNRRYRAVDYAVFSVIYGFYLSYLGYFALPGIGPRFTLHDFESLSEELPGLLLTEPLRDFTNLGESIPTGTPNPAELVQRDIFPSGHTMITLIVMYLSFKLRSRSRYFLIPVGSLLIFSTVYLRYHYFIDLVGGAAFAAFSLWSGKYIYNWWQRTSGKQEFDYQNSYD
ncbi:MAG TPA: phosphatase PAP2 family protein [Ignavibacteriaceae bacterium]|nr:phosphatase PAP2 family protein [Ignavibacteriaceae bacterium]